jgi:hypothetical protein
MYVFGRVSFLGPPVGEEVQRPLVPSYSSSSQAGQIQRALCVDVPK